MDSLTQIVLGASVAGVCAPAGSRRKALLVGAGLGTLPDMDILIDYGGAVENYTYHRGFSHSLFVLAPFAALLWFVLSKFWAPVRKSPGRWFLAIFLALVTHPLLDAHTSYGTQLFWPLTPPPVAWSTIFVIDPLYTLPLLAAMVVALIRPMAELTQKLLLAGIITSSMYLGWTWIGKSIVEENVERTLVAQGINANSYYTAPTPFNSLLWRVVVMTDDGYLEGFDSLLFDDGPVNFVSYPSDRLSLEKASDVWAVKRLRWFSRDLLKAEVKDGILSLSDLRMGQEPFYVFNHEVARIGNPHWHAIETKRISNRFNLAVLKKNWERIWSIQG